MFRSPWILDNTYHVLHHLHHPVALGGRRGRPGPEVGGLQGHQQQSHRRAGGGAPRRGEPQPPGCEFWFQPQCCRKSFFFLPKIVLFTIKRKRYLSRGGTDSLQFIRESWLRTAGSGTSWRRPSRPWSPVWRGRTRWNCYGHSCPCSCSGSSWVCGVPTPCAVTRPRSFGGTGNNCLIII